MSLTIGIVGLPNVGKSTLFNALTKNDVLAANYPFATIEPNVGVVGVPDPRLAKLAEIFASAASPPGDRRLRRHRGHRPRRLRGRGPGQQVPGEHPRVRRDLPGHPRLQGRERRPRRRQGLAQGRHRDDQHRADPRRPPDHREGAAAPAEGVADQEGHGRRRSRRSRRRKEILEKGRHPLLRRASSRAPSSAELLHDLHLLTTKPFLYVFNVDEDELTDEAFKDEQRALVAPAEAIFLNAKLEADLAELDEDEALELLQSVGQDEPGLATLARVGFDTLGLQTYLTAGPKESRAWTIKKGATAPEAAGVIHTDFQKGFIKAEVISFDDLVDTGSVAEARAAGKARMEGKDYVMQDGDVVEFRFNV